MKLSNFKLVNENTQKQKFSTIVQEFNNTYTEYPRTKTVKEIFEEIATQYPNKCAVKFNEEALNYMELDKISNRIARLLKDNKVHPSDPVAILLDPSIDILTSILGILKAGCAYVPINPDFPYERIQYILNDTQAKVIISSKNFVDQLNKLQWECKNLAAYLCLDSGDIKSVTEGVSELMKKELWDYVGEEASNDISAGGWKNSYTGEDLSREIMDEYGDNALLKLTPYLTKEKKALEIGCASGITMFRVAPLIKEYYGTDLSSEILKKTEKEKQERGIHNIQLQVLPAHDIDKIGETKFDIIILNSVTQCFSGLNYLRQVLTKAISLLNDQGIIFIGDIMDQDLKKNLLDSLTEFKKQNIGKNFTTKTDWSNELFLARQFFEDLTIDFPEIRSVEFSGKIFNTACELTDFRYDAILKIDKSNTEVIKGEKAKHQLDASVLESYSAERIADTSHPENLAYIMYTSGSTGKPKGVLINQKSIVRLVRNTNYITISENDTILSLSNYSFDGSTFDYFAALLNGATVVLSPKEIFLSPLKFSGVIEKNNISVFFITTALFNLIIENNLDALSAVRKILFGGETVSMKHVRKFLDKYGSDKLVHVYGPTENTTFSTFFPVSELGPNHHTVPIGKPISNSQCYVLNEYLHPLPIGISGELYVAGDGLSPGYLNDEELTSRKFIDNPFIAGAKLYKTGDFVKWIEGGDIEFIGRIDNQVKIRGFRIELEEIQNKLKEIPEISDAFVTVINLTQDEQTLCAYVVTDRVMDVENIKFQLSLVLPDFMVPAFIVPMAKLPINANGKVDKKQLPAPDFSDSTTHEQPATPTEALLIKIWEEVLGIPKINTKQNFFDIGGHSLKATRLVSRIYKDFLVELSIREIFQNPTIEQLGKLIAQKKQVHLIDIVPVSQEAHYQVSHSQKRLWVLNHLEKDNIVYNMPGAYMLEGVLDKNAFERSLVMLLERHEILRTTFIEYNGEPRQKVHSLADYHFKLEFKDLKSDPLAEQKAREMAQEEIRVPFDLEKGPLFRAKLIELAEEKFIFLYTMHHIISDGWSMEVLLSEVITLYEAFRKALPDPLRPLKLQYKDFAHWQNQQLQDERVKEHKAYWKKKFEGEIPVLHLPSDFHRPAVKTYEGERVGLFLNRNYSHQLEAYCQSNGVSLFMVLLASLKALLFRYTGQEDIIIGTPVAGRTHADLEDQIGFYVNTLAIRTQFSASDDFQTLVTKVKEVTLGAYEHQIYPFDRLVEDLTLKRDMSRSPLFDVMVVLQNMRGIFKNQSKGLGGVASQQYEVTSVTSEFDLTIYFDQFDSGIQVSVQYNKAIYRADRMNRMLRHYQTLLDSILAGRQEKITELNYIPEEERLSILNFNNNAAHYPERICLHTLFEQQVLKNPDKVAIQFEDTVLTYAQLNEASNKLGYFLREHYSIAKGDPVGLLMNRQEKMLVAILGILKAGGAYVPIDPDFPQQRVTYILTNSQATVLITDKDGEYDLPKIQLPSDWVQIADCPGVNLESNTSSDDLAYVIYTSGSTGTPKGVMVAHEGVVNRIDWMWKKYNFTESDVFFQKTPYIFDVSVWELFMPVCFGAQEVMCRKEVIYDPSLLVEHIERYKITAIHFVPGMYNSFLDWAHREDFLRLASLQKVFSSGEALSPELVKKHYKYLSIPLHNLYGPTEASVDVTSYETNAGDTMIPIGKPISNVEMFVLGQYNKLVGIGIEGEIHIGGICLAKGYINNEELTSRKFIPHPFRENKKLYKTGDAGRWLEDGNLEFLGRKDDQIKIRGFRIELGEIENKILEFPGISGCVVIARGNATGEKELVAYVISELEGVKDDLKKYLKKFLPEYMIPQAFIHVEKFPLTPGGKIDKKLLSAEIKVESSPLVDSMVSEQEAELIKIWEDVLGRSPITTQDNFFEIGGHSIKAIQIISRIYKTFGVRVELRNLFMDPTIQALARDIQELKREVYDEIQPLEPRNHYEVSHAQKRLWILDQVEGGLSAYNMPVAQSFKGALNKNDLENAVLALIKRHEILRTTFVSINGEPKQVIHDTEKYPFKLEYLDWRNQHEKQKLVQEEIDNEATKPFDLTKGPLFRAKLIQVEEDYHVFIFVMHHIITDGWSMKVLVDELLTLYRVINEGMANPLPELKIQYKDFVAWNKKALARESITAHKQYWHKKLSGNLPVLTLPTDYIRPPSRSFKGAKYNFNLDKERSDLIRKVCIETECSLFIFLLTTIKILLHKYSGQKDLIVGSPIAGRNHPDLENQVGLYLNNLVLRTQIDRQESFTELLSQVKQTILQAYSHQIYPFDLLVEELGVEQSNRNPFYDVLVVMNNLELKNSKKSLSSPIQGMQINEYSSKLDLTFFINDFEQIGILMEYNTTIFAAPSIEKMKNELISLIDVAVGNPNARVNEMIWKVSADRREELESSKTNLISEDF